MTSATQSNVSAARHSTTATKLGAMLALGVASIALIGSITPAAAGKNGAQGVQYRAAPAAVTRTPPPVRDHRPGPVARDARTGTVTRDHGSGSTVTVTGGRSRKVPCYGNLCGIKVCAAGVCF